MSYATLLAQRCTVVHIGDAGTTDRYNNPVRAETGRDEDVPCRLDQLTGEELTNQRDTAGASHRAFFLADQALGPFDRVEIDAVPYEVTGPPAVVYGMAAPHHLEALLRSLSDWIYP